MSELDISYPLHWPTGWKRGSYPGLRSAFKMNSIEAARIYVLRELRLLGAKGGCTVISSNLRVRIDGYPYSGQAQPADRGIAVYFTMPPDRRQVLACDRWNKVEHNLYAIGLHVSAVRAQARYGVGTVEQAFAGYLALPAPPSPWEVLGLKDNASPAEVDKAFRELSRAAHPDAGGSDDAMARLSEARAAIRSLVDTGA